jgi:hypothetical protein
MCQKIGTGKCNYKGFVLFEHRSPITRRPSPKRAPKRPRRLLDLITRRSAW